MRFSEQNELYGGPTRWVTNKIGHNGLYPSEYRAFPFPVYANQPQKRLAFAGSQLEVFDKRQSRLVVETGQEGQQPLDCATWLHKARVMPKEEFKQEIERELTGKETEPWEISYFKLYQSQIPVTERAIERQL